MKKEPTEGKKPAKAKKAKGANGIS